MKKFLGWLGGIAATVIAGVLVYRLTTPPPPPPEIMFEGMVIDGEQNVPVRSALVSFEVNGANPGDAYHDLTDEHGSYGIKLAGLSKSSSVVLRVHARGYRDDSKQFAALLDDNRYDPVLRALPTPTPAPTAGATPASTPVATPTPPIPVHPTYIQKLALQTIRVQQLEKK